MSTIRFVHTDFLRLGTPLVGIAGPPTWLQQLATSSVRHAVRNVIEATITQQADFLLIAGGICDSPEDLESAAHWLNDQFAPLRREGIRVVAVSDDHRTTTALEQICDVVLSRSESLNATMDAHGSLRLTKSHQHNSRSGELVVTTDTQQARLPFENGGPHYHAVPALKATGDSERSSRQSTLSLSAGAVQSINSTETGNCGCLVVDANLQTGELSSAFVVSNPVRFATENLNLAELTSPDRLVSEIVHASKSLQRSTGQTVIIDWQVNAPMKCDAHELSSLNQQQLLGRLRNHLEAGHQGVWPRSVRFRETADLQLLSPGGAAVEEYFEVVTGSVNTQHIDEFGSSMSVMRGGQRITGALVAGLELLTDAA